MPVIFEAPEKTKQPKKKITKKMGRKLNHLARGNPLSAFLLRPAGVRYGAQEEKEEIILLLRRHPVTNLPWMAPLIVFLLIPPLFIPLFSFLKMIPPNFPASFKLIGTFFWYLGCFGFFLVNFLLWYFNVNLVTNKRIIDLDFISLLYKEITATRISQVEDVTYKMGGLISTIFNYGDVLVATAGPQVNIEFLGVPKPGEAARIIIDLLGK